MIQKTSSILEHKSDLEEIELEDDDFFVDFEDVVQQDQMSSTENFEDSSINTFVMFFYDGRHFNNIREIDKFDKVDEKSYYSILDET